LFAGRLAVVALGLPVSTRTFRIRVPRLPAVLTGIASTRGGWNLVCAPGATFAVLALAISLTTLPRSPVPVGGGLRRGSMKREHGHPWRKGASCFGCSRMLQSALPWGGRDSLPTLRQHGVAQPGRKGPGT